MSIVSKLKCNTKQFWKYFDRSRCYQFAFPHIAQCRHYSENQQSAQCKVAVFTGGVTGSALHIAESFLDNGGRAVVIGGSDSIEIRSFTKRLNQKYGETEKVIFQPCDLTNTGEVEKLFEFVKGKFKGIEFVVNGAEVDTTIDETISININSVILGTLLGLKYMNKKSGGKGGCIINISSVLAIEPFFGCPVFSGTKAFIVGFSRSLGSEYFFNKTGVKVLTLCPHISDFIVNNKSRCMPGFKTVQNDNEFIRCNLEKMHVSHSEEFLGLFELIKHSENGSVWIADGCKFFKACFDEWGGRKPPEDVCPKNECDSPKIKETCTSKKVSDPRGSMHCIPCKLETIRPYSKADMCKLKTMEKEVLQIVDQVNTATAHCRKADPRKKDTCIPCKNEPPRIYKIDVSKLQTICKELKKMEDKIKKKK